MKKVEKEQASTVTVYISRDGREFDTEEGCLRYEALLDEDERRAEVKEYVTGLEVALGKDEYPFIPLDVFVKADGNMTEVKSTLRNKSYRYKIYELHNKKEARMLAEFMATDVSGHTTADTVLKDSGRLQYPCKVLASYSYHWGGTMGTFASAMRLIQKYCKLHGYAVSFEKIQSEEA